MKIFIIAIATLTLAFHLPLTGQISKDTIHLKGIVVRDTINRISPHVINTILKKDIDRIATRDVGDFLRTLPNVSGIRKGGVSIDPVIRGFKFSQLNTVLDDGIKIENGCPNRMDPVSCHVEAEDLEKMEVMKGPYALQYGPSLGGTINLVTNKPKPYPHFEMHARASYGFESNWNGQKEHVSLYGGNSKIYFLLSANYRDYGNYTSGKINNEDTVFNSSFKKYDYSAKLGFKIAEKQELILSFTDSKGRDVLYPALPMDEKTDDTWIAFAEYKAHDISETARLLSVKIYRTQVDHVMDNSFRANYASRQMVAAVDAFNTGGRAMVQLAFNKHYISTGIDVENIYKDGNRSMTMQMMGTTSTKNTNLWLDAKILNLGWFSNYNISFNKYELNAGLRLDLNTATSGDTLLISKNGTDYFNKVNSQYLNLSANVGLTRKLSDCLSLSLSLARGARSPNNLERFIKLMSVGYDNFDYLGNPALKPEINNEADLTIAYKNERLGSLYLNGFYSYVQDYINANLLAPSIVTPQTQGVLGVKQFENTDYILARGFELGYTSESHSKLMGSASLAYTFAEIPEVTKYIVTGNQVVGEEQITNDALSEIPPLEANVSVSYRLLQGKLVPKVHFRAVADQNHVSEAFYEPKTPGFATWAFSAHYAPVSYFEVNAGINNIFNRSYYEHLNRKIIGSTGKLFEPGRVFYVMMTLKI